MIQRERRAFLIFWLVVVSLILGSFIAEAALRQEVCISAQIADTTGTTIYPTVCR